MKRPRFHFRFPLNREGKFYVSDRCVFCDFCAVLAPDLFERHAASGLYYVARQPRDAAEKEIMAEAVAACPTSAIHEDGDRYSWDGEPIMDWNRHLRDDLGADRFTLPEKVIPYEECLKNGRYRYEWCDAEDCRTMNAKKWTSESLIEAVVSDANRLPLESFRRKVANSDLPLHVTLESIEILIRQDHLGVCLLLASRAAEKHDHPLLSEVQAKLLWVKGDEGTALLVTREAIEKWQRPYLVDLEAALLELSAKEKQEGED